MRHNHTGAKTWASKESSANWSKPKPDNSSTDEEHSELKGEYYIFSLFFHNSDPFQGPLGGWMVLDPAALASRIVSCGASSISLMQTEKVLGGCREAGNKKKCNVSNNWVGGQWFHPEPGKYNVSLANTTTTKTPVLVKSLSFPSDLTGAAFSPSKDAAPWKSTNRKIFLFSRVFWTKWQTMYRKNLKPGPHVTCFAQECFDRWMHSDREIKKMNPVKVSWLFLFPTSRIFEWLNAKICFYVWEAINNNKTVDRSFILFD